ncbi:IclR family transcriptional regulator domain-containing protein [Saccharothrix hoggarensis]|uniref:IclR family transcriptional regulator C-terminal domain-containing protein n=1 Tax=Saccharothrix hoggarensis TaxID=913853 RepID=A0ABW3R4I9_9PSEU
MPDVAPTEAAPGPVTGAGAGTLERGLAVLHAVASHPEPRLRRGDLTKATGLPRSTVDRIAATLLHLGYLRAEGPDLLLSLRAMELGNAYLASCGLVHPLAPLLTRLADELDESVTLTVPDVDGVRLIAQSTRRRAVYLAFHVGGVLPDDRTAAGVVLAATWPEERFAAWRRRRAGDPLDAGFPAVPPLTAPPDDREVLFRARVAEARAKGWALDDQWVEPGLLAIAAPVHDPAGRPVAAVNVLTHTSRHTADTFPDTVLPRLRVAVADMEAALRPPATTPRPATTTKTAAPAAAAVDAAAVTATAAAAPATEAATTRASGVGADATAIGTAGVGGVGTGVAVTGAAGVGAVGTTTIGAAGAGDAAIGARVTGAGGTGVRGAEPTADDLRSAKEALGMEFLETLARGLAVLTAFRHAPDGLTISTAAEASGLPRASARRALHVLCDAGYASTDGRKFALLPRVLDLGYARLAPLTVSDIAQPHLADLAAAVGESVSLAVLDGDQVRYVARVAAGRVMRVDITVGSRFPARATSLGRVLLAARRGTPADDWAIVDEELNEGLRSLAVGVRDGSGAVIAAVGVALHVGRTTQAETAARLLPPLRLAAARIEADVAVAFDQAQLVVH